LTLLGGLGVAASGLCAVLIAAAVLTATGSPATAQQAPEETFVGNIGLSAGSQATTNWDSARTVTVYRYPQAAAGTATISHTTNRRHDRVGGTVTVTLAGASQYETVPVPDPPPVVYDTVEHLGQHHLARHDS